MEPYGAEKTAFRTPTDNFHYAVLPFGLKNSSDINLLAMIGIFHDLPCRCPEDYIDNIVVKIKGSRPTRRWFKESLPTMLELQPENESIEVGIWRLIKKNHGFIVHKKDIDVD